MLIFFIVYWNECNLLSSLDRSLGTMTARISTPLGCSLDKGENIKGTQVHQFSKHAWHRTQDYQEIFERQIVPNSHNSFFIVNEKVRFTFFWSN